MSLNDVSPFVIYKCILSKKNCESWVSKNYFVKTMVVCIKWTVYHKFSCENLISTLGFYYVSCYLPIHSHCVCCELLKSKLQTLEEAACRIESVVKLRFVRVVWKSRQ